MRYRGAFLLSGGYRRARRERVAHVGQGLREEGNGVPEMAGPLLGDARTAPGLAQLSILSWFAPRFQGVPFLASY